MVGTFLYTSVKYSYGHSLIEANASQVHCMPCGQHHIGHAHAMGAIRPVRTMDYI